MPAALGWDAQAESLMDGGGNNWVPGPKPARKVVCGGIPDGLTIACQHKRAVARCEQRGQRLVAAGRRRVCAANDRWFRKHRIKQLASFHGFDSGAA